MRRNRVQFKTSKKYSFLEQREILVDQEISGAKESFTQFGRVRGFDGRKLKSYDLAEAEVLVVRSVTTIDRGLLADSQINLVCSVTSGVDHVDTRFLQAAGIEFFSTRGCNSRAVVEYTISCILLQVSLLGVSLEDLRVGILGFGNVGRKLADVLEQLGVSYLVNDPPLRKEIDPAIFADLEEIMACDVVTLHVPLTSGTLFPTESLIDYPLLKKMRKDSLLINTSRGGVISEASLIRRLRENDNIYVVLDCWSDEPYINASLASTVWKASPHIAGGSIESRYNAVVAVIRVLADYCGIEPNFSLSEEYFDINRKVGIASRKCVTDLIDDIIPINSSTLQMRALKNLNERLEVGRKFDEMRRRFTSRREFDHYDIYFDSPERELIIKLGFQAGGC